MVATAQHRPDNTVLAVTLIVVAVFMMSVQDMVFKQYSTTMSMWQIFTLRGLFALPLVFVIAFASGRQSDLLSGAFQKWSIIRSVLIVTMLISMYAALPVLSLSVVAAGMYTAPIFVTIMSALAINEPVGKRVWCAIAIGFAGVLIILQPGTDAFSYWVLLPVLGGFLYALANVVTRAKCQSISATALALSLQMGFFIAGALLSTGLLLWPPTGEQAASAPFVLGAWSSIGTPEWLLVAGLSVLAVLVGMALAGAYQLGRPSTVAAFDYSYLVFVAVWDYLFFSISPTITTTIGVFLIVVAGLLVLRKGQSELDTPSS
ncbi:MAG: DMT family transporter [Woeseiaceae bacterium]